MLKIIYCIKCNKCSKFQNLKRSCVSIKCGSNYDKIFKEKEFIMILKTLDLINNNNMTMIVIKPK